MTWRPMTVRDLPAIDRLAQRIHPDYPEDAGVFAERLQLYPAGCWVCEQAHEPVGYAVSHPWRVDAAPKLNALLDALPAPADAYYLHDIALLAEQRGAGLATGIVALLLQHARTAKFPTCSLIAVNRSQPFWERHGFAVREVAALRDRLNSYDAAAVYMQAKLH